VRVSLKRCEVMVFSRQRGLMPERKQTWDMRAMDLWIALGIFVVGAGIGALTTAALYVQQICQLKDLLEDGTQQSQNRRTMPQT
jgi:hypothetical protein